MVTYARGRRTFILMLFFHSRVIFKVSSTNGGYVKVADRQASSSDGVKYKYYYSGKTKTREFEFHWDLVNPYHCSESSGTSCTPFVFISSDITNNVSFVVSYLFCC